jgi:hypothetical protein
MDHYSLQVVPFDKKYQEIIDDALKEFEKFFKVKLSQNLCLIYLNSRQQFDDIVGRKTLPFETAYSTSNLIFMMSEVVYEKESNKKFDSQKNLLTLRHEICHKFFQRMAWTSRPVWLNEGTSIYLSGQLKNYPKIENFSNFLLFESSNYVDEQDVYKESGFVVQKIIEKFGKDKFLDFLKSIRSVPDNLGFLKIFNQVYGFELNYDNMNKL